MSHPTAEIRLKVIEAHKNGNNITDLVKIFGYHRNTIARWISQAKKNPTLARKRSPGSGRPSKISSIHRKKILGIIKRKASAYGFESDLWTIRRIQQVLKKELNIQLSKSTMHEKLKRLNLSYKKPLKRYFEASKQKQDAWAKEELPKIKNLVRKKQALLYFLDESCIQLSPVIGKTWGPKNERIVQHVTGNRGSISVISTVSTRGDLLFSVKNAGKRFCAEDIIDYLKEMLKHHPRRFLVVVMDQAACHVAKKVREFVSQQKRLEVFYLPPRSPDFNPDEKVWNHLKNHELKSHKAKTTGELKKLVKKKLRSMAANKKLMMGVFMRCEKSDFYL